MAIDLPPPGPNAVYVDHRNNECSVTGDTFAVVQGDYGPVILHLKSGAVTNVTGPRPEPQEDPKPTQKPVKARPPPAIRSEEKEPKAEAVGPRSGNPVAVLRAILRL